MTPETKCSCDPKDGQGADEGVWVTMEVLNIPWTEELLDLTSDAFKNAKYIVEKAVRKQTELAFFFVSFISPPLGIRLHRQGA